VTPMTVSWADAIRERVARYEQAERYVAAHPELHVTELERWGGKDPRKQVARRAILRWINEGGTPPWEQT
jgi:hypothetical protein